jgi:hypothetical protein
MGAKQLSLSEQGAYFCSRHHSLLSAARRSEQTRCSSLKTMTVSERYLTAMRTCRYGH